MADDPYEAVRKIIMGDGGSAPAPGGKPVEEPTKKTDPYDRFRAEMKAGLWGEELTDEQAINEKIQGFHDTEREARMSRMQEQRAKNIPIQDEQLEYFGMPKAAPREPAGPPTPQLSLRPRGYDPPIADGSDPRTESWMKKDPKTWYPRDPNEKARWRKSLSNKDLVEWSGLAKEASDWHLKTRNGGAPAYTWGLPEYKSFRSRYDSFMQRTVPMWRQMEERSPPHQYRSRRRRSAVEGLGGIELDVG